MYRELSSGLTAQKYALGLETFVFVHIHCQLQNLVQVFRKALSELLYLSLIQV